MLDVLVCYVRLRGGGIITCRPSSRPLRSRGRGGAARDAASRGAARTPIPACEEARGAVSGGVTSGRSGGTQATPCISTTASGTITSASHGPSSGGEAVSLASRASRRRGAGSAPTIRVSRVVLAVRLTEGGPTHEEASATTATSRGAGSSGRRHGASRTLVRISASTAVSATSGHVSVSGLLVGALARATAGSAAASGRTDGASTVTLLPASKGRGVSTAPGPQRVRREPAIRTPPTRRRGGVGAVEAPRRRGKRATHGTRRDRHMSNIYTR